MVNTAMQLIALRLGRMQFDPFGLYVRTDGTFGEICFEEGGETCDDVVRRIKGLAPNVAACVIVAMRSFEDCDDECFFVLFVEDRSGLCSISCTNMARDEDGTYDVTDDGVQLPGIPFVFAAVHH
ncbi:MAG: hypothetical protein HOQ01_06545 [Lysobacter sp.]|nr:hypothetical protein [Lysobacter sp.]